MGIPKHIGRSLIYGFVFVSGAAGLIYQVAWHKYLAVLLGAQARATTIVIAIFLGGISLGYWTFGQWTRWKRWNLLLVYSFVEIAMGFWAFLFPYFYHLAFRAMPGTYKLLGLNSIIIDLAFSIALIGLPTFLMGATLPLLTQGLSDDLKDASKTHARIYGFNTVGACFGCLGAGYILIPNTDLPNAVMFGGVLNVTVGLLTYFLFAKWAKPQEVIVPQIRSNTSVAITPYQTCLLAIGFLSGFYTIALETIFIRLMGLSTGSSNYNFTLIVSIFILGLGIGSLIVREIAKYNPIQLVINQILIVLTLFFLYLTGDSWPYLVHLLRATLKSIPENFYFYHFLLGIGFTAILIVPIGFAGLALPMCFHLIKDTKEGLGQRVGQLYGINTIGSVLGALLGGYFLLNYLNLDQLFKLCLILTVISAVIAGYPFYRDLFRHAFKTAAVATLTLALLVLIIIAPSYRKERYIQPFRHPDPIQQVTFQGAAAFEKYLSRYTKIAFWKDDPNTSVGIGRTVVNDKEVSRTILINGKSDGNTRGDLFTTVMLGHIPALLAKKIDRACIIGFGTGMTIGTIGLYSDIQQIDVVEISRALIANRGLFDDYNNKVFGDPKVRIHEMDAFRFLAGTDPNQRYNVIISEPSNPWVAGIENLYSSEFYKIARRKLVDGGMFAQWIHTYSFTDDLMKMVIKTMSAHFDYVSVFQLRGGDLLLLGRTGRILREDLQRAANRMKQRAVAESLQRAGIDRIESVLGLEVVPAMATKALGEYSTEHTLESPKLSNGASRAFFADQSTNVLDLRRKYKEYYQSIDQSLLAVYLGGQPPTSDVLQGYRRTFCDSDFGVNRSLCEESVLMTSFAEPKFKPTEKQMRVISQRELSSVAANYQKVPPMKFTLEALQSINGNFEMYKRYVSPIAQLPLRPLLAQLDYCLKTTPFNNELYGECLLQKILVLETTQVASPMLNSNIQQYLDWFPNLDKTSPNYKKLSEANVILRKMLTQNKSN